MPAHKKGIQKVWSQAATPSPAEWRGVLNVFKDKKWEPFRKKIALLRKSGGTMRRSAFGIFNRYNSLLRAAKSPFRIAFIGAEGRSIHQMIGIVREADGVDRDTIKKGEIEFAIERVEVSLDPAVDIFELELTRGNGSWRKSFGSEELLRAFLEGVQACASLYGHIMMLPEIPAKANRSIS